MMTEDSWIALPSDRLVVTWASEDPESEMEEFHVGAGSSRTAADNPDLIPLTSTHVHHAFHAHHSGLGQGAIFFLFIRGLSKAGLQVQLVLGPILVDSTSPEVRRALQASVDGDALTASWRNETFVDLEQPASVELEISFRVVKAVVLDVLPTAAESDSGAASDVLQDVDVIVVPDIVCAAWSGSLPADAQVSLGVGTNVDLDDVTSFTTVNGSDGRACVNVSAVPVYTTLFSLVKVNNSDTTAVLASDGFIAVQPQDPDNVLSVFNGRGCRAQDVIGSVVVKTGTSDLAVDLTTSSPLHAGDVVYVRLKPFTPQVLIDNAVVLQTTTTGYQVIMTKSANLSLTLPAVPTADVLIEVQHCLKDSTFLATRDIVTATWEIAGPWSDLATYLQVEVLDRTCLQQSTGQQTQQDRERCLVAEKRVAPKERSVTFLDVETFPLNTYATSVAVCFDDECLPSESSLDVVAIPGPGSVTLSGATLLSQSARDVEVEFKADVELFLPNRTCFYQWSLARTDDGSKRLVPWRVQQAADCSDIEVNPFHVIELSHDVMRVTNLDNVLHSQQLGHKLHDLYDLDLDFARSDLLPTAIVTHSYGREITWFLMREARVPENAGACAADADCVTSEVSDDGTVTFPRDKADLQGRRVYYVCASLAALDLTNDVQNRSAAGYPEAQEVCGNGFVVDDDPPLPGTVVISNANSGYLAYRGRVLVTWSGFSDVEKDVTDLPFQTTLNYSVALGNDEPIGE
nr:hypothetical protein BaRGS_025108 [Batillaria attramentaria]